MELFEKTYKPSSMEECSCMMTLTEIKEWWKENIGPPPDNLSEQLTAAGYKAEAVDDLLLWPLATNIEG